MPLTKVPFHVLESGYRFNAHATQQDDHGTATGGDKTEHKGIFGPTIVTFQHGIAERRLRMQLDLVRSRTDQVMDQMAATSITRSTTATIAKPLVGLDALGDARRIVNATVATGPFRETVLVVVIVQPLVHVVVIIFGQFGIVVIVVSRRHIRDIVVVIIVIRRIVVATRRTVIVLARTGSILFVVVVAGVEVYNRVSARSCIVHYGRCCSICFRDSCGCGATVIFRRHVSLLDFGR